VIAIPFDGATIDAGSSSERDDAIRRLEKLCSKRLRFWDWLEVYRVTGAQRWSVVGVDSG
jgi:hypothetical protein